MNTILLASVLATNLAVGTWTAAAVGKIWLEAGAVGGLARAIAWIGAALSTYCFTLVLAIVVGHCASPAVLMSPRQAQSALWSLIDLAIILPMVAAVIAIAIHAWIMAARAEALAALDPARGRAFALARDRAAGRSTHLALLRTCGFVGAANGKEVQSGAGAIAATTLGALLCLVSGVLMTRVIVLAHAGSLPAPGEQEAAARNGRETVDEMQMSRA